MSESESNPIFIVGAPRSGTSLLRVMLNRHPSIGLSDELYYFYYVLTGVADLEICLIQKLEKC